MALDFPSNPVNGQVYNNFYYDSTTNAWRSLGSAYAPNYLKNPTFTTSTASGVPVTVQGIASQSGNLQEWKNSSGTALTFITADGSINSSGSFNTSGKIIGTTQPNNGSDGGVAVKAPASGTQTSAFLQFVNNAYTTQYASIEATQSNQLKLNASYVTNPYQPTFAARSDQATTAGNDIVWNYVDFNISSSYNSSNGRFTAPIAGYYYFHL